MLGYIRRQREEFKRRGAVCCALPSTAEAIAWVERKGIAVDVFCPANSAEAAAPMPGFTPEPEPGPAAHAESSAPFAEMGDAQRAQLLFEIARDAFVAETFLVTTPLSLCLWERLLYLQPCALGHLHAAWVAYMLFHVERCLCHIVRALQLQPGLGACHPHSPVPPGQGPRRLRRHSPRASPLCALLVTQAPRGTTWAR